MRRIPTQALAIACLLAACEPSRPLSTAETQGPSTASGSPPRPALSGATPTVRASASTAPTSAVAPPPLPALYAELFQEGARIELAVKTRVTAQGNAKVGQRRASCEVGAAEPISEGRRSHVTCVNMPDVDVADPLSGVWTFTAAGLFHHHFEAPKPLMLDDAHLVFVPGPQPAVRAMDVNADEGSSLEIVKRGNAWCSEREFRGGDPSWMSICIEEGAGVRTGKWGWTGGTTHEAELERVPERPPAKGSPSGARGR